MPSEVTIRISAKDDASAVITAVGLVLGPTAAVGVALLVVGWAQVGE